MVGVGSLVVGEVFVARGARGLVASPGAAVRGDLIGRGPRSLRGVLDARRGGLLQEVA